MLFYKFAQRTNWNSSFCQRLDPVLQKCPVLLCIDIYRKIITSKIGEITIDNKFK